MPEEDEDAGESSAAEIQVVHASKAKKAVRPSLSFPFRLSRRGNVAHESTLAMQRKTEVLVLEDSDNELLPAPFKPAAPVQPEPVRLPSPSSLLLTYHSLTLSPLDRLVPTRRSSHSPCVPLTRPAPARLALSASLGPCSRTRTTRVGRRATTRAG